MIRQTSFLLSRPIRITFYEGESGQQTQTPTPTPTPIPTPVPPPANPNPNPAPPPTPIAFSPEQQQRVNALLAEEKRKTQEQARKDNEKTIQELEGLRNNVNLTQQERDRLTARIEELQTQFQTKEQQQQTEYQKLQQKYQKDTKDLTTDRDTWRGRYEHHVITVDIKDSARKYRAISDEQMDAIVRPWTRVVEELGADGKPSGVMVARVNFTGKDKEGKPVKLELSIDEAVKAMREWPDKYGNLFHSDSHGGTGASPTTTGGTNVNGVIPDIDSMSAVDYRRYRDKIRQQLATGS